MLVGVRHQCGAAALPERLIRTFGENFLNILAVFVAFWRTSRSSDRPRYCDTTSPTSKSSAFVLAYLERDGVPTRAGASSHSLSGVLTDGDRVGEFLAVAGCAKTLHIVIKRAFRTTRPRMMYLPVRAFQALSALVAKIVQVDLWRLTECVVRMIENVRNLTLQTGIENWNRRFRIDLEYGR